MKRKPFLTIAGVLIGLVIGCSTTKPPADVMKDPVKIEMDTIYGTYWIGDKENGIRIISKDGLFGLANTEGLIMTDAIYDRIFPFREGRAIMCKNNRFGVLDATGKEIAPPIYTQLDGFKNGLCYGTSVVFESVLLNKQGENIVPGKNIRISRINGRYVQLKEGNFHVFNQEGKIVHTSNYFALRDKVEESWNKMKYWWFTKEPAFNQEGFQRDPEIPQAMPFYFKEGMAVVPKLVDEKVMYGFINDQGEQVIPFQFENAKTFVGAYACAKKGNKWGGIDKKGIWVIDPTFDDIESTNGKFFIYSDGILKGILNAQGEIIIQAKYLKVQHLFEDVFACLESNDITRKHTIEYQNGFNPWSGGNFWGCINASNGNTLLPFRFHEVLKANEHIATGWNYTFTQIPPTEEELNLPPMSLSPPRDYIGKASAQVFTATQLEDSFELPELLIPQVTSSPGFKEIERFELFEAIDEFVLLSEKYISPQGKVIDNPKLIKDLDERLNRFIVTQQSKSKYYGLKNWEGKQILEEKYQAIDIGNTGIIARLNNKFGFYDFKGQLLFEHKYSLMNERYTGILEVSKDEPKPGSVLQTVLLNKAGIQIEN